MAVTGSLTAFLASWAIGAIGIYIGGRIVTGEGGLFSAAFTSLIGAAVWGLTISLVDFTGIGPLLALIAWILVIDLRYEGGIVNAVFVGLVAWVAALGMIYLLTFLGLSTPQALGIPNI